MHGDGWCVQYLRRTIHGNNGAVFNLGRRDITDPVDVLNRSAWDMTGAFSPADDREGRQ